MDFDGGCLYKDQCRMFWLLCAAWLHDWMMVVGNMQW